MKKLSILLLVLLLQSVWIRSKEPEKLAIYLDADRTGAKNSGNSIEQGIVTALSEVGNEVNGIKIELITKDHHGNSRRSKKHLDEFILDPSAIAIFCGLHSPPVISNLDFINNNGILMLSPWAAAAGITRGVGLDGLNWVFRLSVDDSKAGEVLVSHAMDREKFKKPLLLLEDTGWGRSNFNVITNAIVSRGLEAPEVIWFPWGLKELGAKDILTDIYQKSPDVIFFVGNTPEAVIFFNIMAEKNGNKSIPIRSHWGITGGDFFEKLGANIIVDSLDLKFIQTSFSFLNSKKLISERVFTRATELFPEITNKDDIKAPNGFIHGYDLTKILLSALESSNLTDDIIMNRAVVKDKLENLTVPVEGLIKSYESPFSVFSSENESGHEALSFQDYKMAFFLKDGSIEVIDE